MHADNDGTKHSGYVNGAGKCEQVTLNRNFPLPSLSPPSHALFPSPPSLSPPYRPLRCSALHPSRCRAPVSPTLNSPIYTPSQARHAGTLVSVVARLRIYLRTHARTCTSRAYTQCVCGLPRHGRRATCGQPCQHHPAKTGVKSCATCLVNALRAALLVASGAIGFSYRV